MDPEKLSQSIFKIKVALLLVCVAVVLFYIKNRPLALGIALVFMSLSSLGDIILGYAKMRAGTGFAQSLMIPIIMFIVFATLTLFLFTGLGRI